MRATEKVAATNSSVSAASSDDGAGRGGGGGGGSERNALLSSSVGRRIDRSAAAVGAPSGPLKRQLAISIGAVDVAGKPLIRSAPQCQCAVNHLDVGRPVLRRHALDSSHPSSCLPVARSFILPPSDSAKKLVCSWSLAGIASL
uniref:Uncharacterized protein n=1 Tax=Plectus sambesii TaxID=2011161 RepID=A0A914XS84_9BILA